MGKQISPHLSGFSSYHFSYSKILYGKLCSILRINCKAYHPNREENLPSISFSKLRKPQLFYHLS